MISQGLKLKQQQALSPKQLMLLRLLQLPTTGLEQAVKEELMRNPLLEEDTPKEESLQSIEPTPDTDHYTSDAEEHDYAVYAHNNNPEVYRPEVVSTTSFIENLSRQLELFPLTERQQMIGEQLIGSIDDDGYLSRSPQLIANDMAFKQGIEVEEEEVEAVLRLVQQLDPPGIGARNLQECLSIQMHRIKPQTSTVELATTIVDKYFEAFSKHHYEQLATRLQVSQNDLQAALELIRSLSPRPGPGRVETQNPDNYVVPDFIVTRHDGKLSFYLNDVHLPTLHLSELYTTMLNELSAKSSLTSDERQTQSFLRSHAEAATDFIDNLSQRRDTLSNSMRAIIEYQRDYFLTGDITKLRPMKQEDIAQITGVDTSTISRIVSSKHVQTEFGTFLLKELFTKGLSTEQGEQLSVDTVKHYLSEIVAAEDKRNPLTDDQLLAELSKKGINIARRTISKYRNALDIPTASLRKTL